MKHLSPASLFRPADPLAALALLLAAAGAAQGQTPASFGAASSYSTGIGSTFTFGVAVADVNGDGRTDIVTFDAVGSRAGVLLGQAGGGFATASIYPTGNGPVGVAVADVNGDGRPDIVTANFFGNSAGVLLGLAGGGFAMASTYSAGANSLPYGVAVADVNGDGRPDIVTANSNLNSAGVLLGLVGGGFAPVSPYSTGAGSSPRSVAVADVNRDGRPDIVTANYNSNTAGVLLGQAGGGFAAVTTYPTGGSQPNDVAVADMNSDGRPDIVTANPGSSTAGVLLGQVGGGFAAVSTYSTGGRAPQGVGVADVNGDGRPDIVTANSSSDTVGVLLGQAGGGFATASTFSTGTNSSPAGVALADVNGDGRPDIVTANTFNNTVGVLLNTGTFTPLAAAPGAPAADVALFPNPARGSFAVQLPAAWGAAPVRAELLNAMGQVVRQQAAALPAGATLHFATEGLAAGVYLLRVQAGGHSLAKRVVLD